MNRELAETYISRALDGELPERQRAELEAWLAAHPEDHALAEAWKDIGQLARVAAASVPVPDEELAWQDIRRTIHQGEPAGDAEPVRFFQWRLSWGIAMVALAFMVVGAWGIRRGQMEAAALAKAGSPVPAHIEWAETEVPGASTMVYQDEDSGLAVVWVMSDETANGKKTSG